MKVELIRTVKHEGRLYTNGDLISVTDSLGGYFCQSGWAKDMSGNVTTAKVSTDPVRLNVQSGIHVNKVKELG